MRKPSSTLSARMIFVMCQHEENNARAQTDGRLTEDLAQLVRHIIDVVLDALRVRRKVRDGVVDVRIELRRRSRERAADLRDVVDERVEVCDKDVHKLLDTVARGRAVHVDDRRTRRDQKREHERRRARNARPSALAVCRAAPAAASPAAAHEAHESEDHRNEQGEHRDEHAWKRKVAQRVGVRIVVGIEQRAILHGVLLHGRRGRNRTKRGQPKSLSAAAGRGPCGRWQRERQVGAIASEAVRSHAHAQCGALSHLESVRGIQPRKAIGDRAELQKLTHRWAGVALKGVRASIQCGQAKRARRRLVEISRPSKQSPDLGVTCVISQCV